MELIEWATFLRTLQLKFEGVTVAERGLTEQRNRNQALYIWQDHWSSHLIYIFQARCTLPRKDRAGSCSHGYDAKYYF
jgi:hypothetical protein